MTTPTLNSKNIINSNSNDVSSSLLGASYNYSANIKNPSELGMSSDGNLSAFARDFKGLIEYTKLLAEGNSSASKTGGPLGNKYFLQTGAKCKDIRSCDNQPEGCELQEVDRFLYVNNIPQGNIPFISSSSGTGTNFKDMRGLIPGALSNLNSLNPFSLFKAFTAGSTPDCQAITLETVSTTNQRGVDTHYVATVDLDSMDPCSYMNGVNPINGRVCKETFTNLHPQRVIEKDPSFPKDPLVKLYFLSLSLLGVYILYKIVLKTK